MAKNPLEVSSDTDRARQEADAAMADAGRAANELEKIAAGQENVEDSERVDLETRKAAEGETSADLDTGENLAPDSGKNDAEEEGKKGFPKMENLGDKLLELKSESAEKARAFMRKLYGRKVYRFIPGEDGKLKKQWITLKPHSKITKEGDAEFIVYKDDGTEDGTLSHNIKNINYRQWERTTDSPQGPHNYRDGKGNKVENAEFREQEGGHMVAVGKGLPEESIPKGDLRRYQDENGNVAYAKTSEARPIPPQGAATGPEKPTPVGPEVEVGIPESKAIPEPAPIKGPDSKKQRKSTFRFRKDEKEGWKWGGGTKEEQEEIKAIIAAIEKEQREAIQAGEAGIIKANDRVDDELGHLSEEVRSSIKLFLAEKSVEATMKAAEKSSRKEGAGSSETVKPYEVKEEDLESETPEDGKAVEGVRVEKPENLLERFGDDYNEAIESLDEYLVTPVAKGVNWVVEKTHVLKPIREVYRVFRGFIDRHPRVAIATGAGTMLGVASLFGPLAPLGYVAGGYAMVRGAHRLGSIGSSPKREPSSDSVPEKPLEAIPLSQEEIENYWKSRTATEIVDEAVPPEPETTPPPSEPKEDPSPGVSPPPAESAPVSEDTPGSPEQGGGMVSTPAGRRKSKLMGGTSVSSNPTEESGLLVKGDAVKVEQEEWLKKENGERAEKGREARELMEFADKLVSVRQAVQRLEGIIGNDATNALLGNLDIVARNFQGVIDLRNAGSSQWKEAKKDSEKELKKFEDLRDAVVERTMKQEAPAGEESKWRERKLKGLPSFYEVLGVSPSISGEDMKKAYRKLSREYHPDRNPGDKMAEARFKDLNDAWGVLGDEEKRGRYNTTL